MRFNEAIELVDEPIDDYSENAAYIKIKGGFDKWVIKSKYGLCICGSDWPQRYTPTEDDLKSNDWEVKSLKETPNF